MHIRYDSSKKSYVVFGTKSETLKYFRTEQEAENWIVEHTEERRIQDYFLYGIPPINSEAR